MNRSTRRRLARASQNVPPPPPDLSALSPVERLHWMSDLVGFENIVRAANAEDKAERRAKAAERAAAEARDPQRAPEPPAKVALSQAPVETRPAPPAKPPHRPRYPGEPDPSYVPPPPNQYAEEMCHWRARGPNEPYDDEPPEDDELDELIYGDQ